MKPTAAAICEQIIDQAGELGVRLTHAADGRRRLPAECTVRLREALDALRHAAWALERDAHAQAAHAPSSRNP
jgi:hypothetical protein